MKRLTLLRHAKSDWDDPAARDFDRALNRRGKRGAALMGQYASERGLRYDLLVASPAVRVTETIDLFLEQYGRSIETVWDRRIYLASAGNLMDVIMDIADSAESVLMVGHNPGFEDLILSMVPDDGSSPLRDEIEMKLPTASMATLELDIEKWADADGHKAKLTAFTRPRDLDPALGPEFR